MLRRALLPVLTVAALAAPAAAPAAPKPFTVRLVACHHGTTDAARYLDVDATVGKVPRARAASLRFDLLARPAGQADFTPYPGPGLGAFRRVTLPVLYQKRIQSLPPRSAYRVRVRARWLGKRGRVVRTDRRITRTCHQPDLRPDLTVLRFVRVAKRRFAAVVRNVGLTAAGPFAVGTTEFGGLGVRRSVRVMVPACSSVSVDPDNRLDERDETNNSAPAPCPSG